VAACLSRFALVKRYLNGLSRGLPLGAALAFANAALGHHFTYRLLAPAAAGRHAELELQFFECVGPVRDGCADLAVGYGLAYADDHGSVTENVNANYYHYVSFAWQAPRPSFCTNRATLRDRDGP